MTDQPGPSHRPAASWEDLQVEVEPGSEAETSVEVPLEDAAEQARPASAAPREPTAARVVPLDVDPADLAEQGREVEEDEDEYR